MTTEKSQIDPHADYFELMTNEREANMNRQGYKNMKRDFFMQKGLDPNVIDFDYAFDAGNEQNKDILPAVKENEDGSVTEDLLLDINTREGMAWASASKVYYDAFYNKKDKTSYLTNQEVHPNSIAAMYTAEDVGPKTPEEFAQWGIEHIGWLNYHLPSLGIQATKLGFKAKSNPQASHAFLHLLNTYGELPMFTWKGTKRFFNGVLQDPTTYVGLGTLGFGLLGKKFLNVGGKSALKSMLRAAVDPKAAAVYEGALYSGVDDFFRQKVAIEAGPDVEGGQDKYNFGRGAMATAFGAGGAGALIGTGEIAKRVGPMAYRAVSDMVNSSAKAANERIKERSTGTTLHSNPVGPIADQIISRMGAGGGDEIPPGRNIDELGFYSKAEEALNNIQQQKGTGRQFVNQLKKKFNVKEKELYWLGLDKFENDNKIDKQVLLEEIAKNRVVIRENKYVYPKTNRDNEDITDVTELDFNITDDTSYDNYNFDAEEMHANFLRMDLDDNVYHEFANSLDYSSERKMLTRRGTVNQLNEEDEFNTTALYAAFRNGEEDFIDFNGDRIDFHSELNDFVDEQARVEYMNNPHRSGNDTLGLGYRIQYNRVDDTYQVTDPSGNDLPTTARTLNEAQVMATTDGYDTGRLLVRDEDEIERMAGAADQQPTDPARNMGQPMHTQWKINGGSNYRELVLENASFKGDPETDAILKEVDEVVAKADIASDERNHADIMLNEYESLPESEKFEYLNRNNTSEGTLKINSINNRLDANDAILKRSEVLNKYAMDKHGMRKNINADKLSRMQALMSGPRGHYSAIKNDIGHMRVTDRISSDGAKVLFIEEMQSDWSQRRSSMPTPENIKRSAEASLTNKTVDEADIKAEEVLNNFFAGYHPHAINEGTVQLFDNVKNSLKLVLDNDSDLNRLLTGYNEKLKEARVDTDDPNDFMLSNTDFSELLDEIEINDFYEKLEGRRTGNISTILTSSSPEETVDRITSNLIDAFTDAYVKKAKMGSLSEGTISNTIKRTLRAEAEKLKPFVDILENIAKNEFIDVSAERAKLKKDKKFLQARDRYGPVPRGPFVQVSDDVVELQIKTLIRRAIDEGHDYISFAGADVHTERWGADYADAFETHYGKVVPKAASKVLKQLDKKAKLTEFAPWDIDIPDDVSAAGLNEMDNVLTIPITDEMRNSVKKGMSLFELGGMAAGGGGAAVVGSQMAGQQENEQPGI